MTRIETPIGPMLAGATESGICLLEFVDRRMIETQLVRLQKLLRAALVPGTSRHFDTMSDELHRYSQESSGVSKPRSTCAARRSSRRCGTP